MKIRACETNLPKKYRHKAIDLSSLPELDRDLLHAVYNYSCGTYDHLNSQLRLGQDISPQSTKKIHERMLSLCVEAKDNLTLWRGATVTAQDHPYHQDQWQGRAWTSSSLARAQARQFANTNCGFQHTKTNYLIKLNVEAGTPILPTAPLLYTLKQSEIPGYPEYLTEQEITLPPGLMYEVVSRRRTKPKSGHVYTFLNVNVKAR